MIALNIGCHDIHIDSLENLDIDESMNPDAVVDCTRLRERYEDNTVDFCYAGHFLEHFDKKTGMQIVKDVHKILKPFGVFIAITPDYTKTYDMSTEEAERIILAEGTHKSLMAIPRLREYFVAAGFQTCAQAHPHEIGYCPFPNVLWQSGMIGIKHPIPLFRGVNR